LPRDLWPAIGRGTAGFLAGIALWLALSPLYAIVLAAVCQPLIRATEHPSVTRLVAGGSQIAIERADFAPGSPRPGLPVTDLTFNVILLTTLFAVSRKPFGDRNMLGLLLASLSMMLVHVIAIVANVQSIYALQLGLWSERNYGAVARNFWGAAAHFYRVVGVFGAGFALWWLFRPPTAEVPNKPRRGPASLQRVRT
jgi:hypothetical protein